MRHLVGGHIVNDDLTWGDHLRIARREIGFLGVILSFPKALFQSIIPTLLLDPRKLRIGAKR
jgi:hypothetical protein